MALALRIEKTAGALGPGTLLVAPSQWPTGRTRPSVLGSLWREAAGRVAQAPDLGREGLLVPGAQNSWLLLVQDPVPSQPAPPVGLAAKILEFARRVRAQTVVLVFPFAQRQSMERMALALRLAGYSHQTYKSKPIPETVETVKLVANVERPEADGILRRVHAFMDGTDLCRNLVNTPSMDLAPEDLARHAAEMATREGLGYQCWHTAELQAHHCEGILSVGRGSHKPPVLIRLDYRPAGKATARKGKGIHLALVGKGVAFDTGGISIKPAADMWRMKGDMAGAGAVLGAMLAIARLAPSIPVTALIPSALNAVDSQAVLPGDIIRGRNGKTVHVDNTDAEGRLILMDALHEARLLGATHCVDIATLTGACSRALGPALSGLFATDDVLAAEILRAGEIHGEPYWRLPLVDEYVSMLKNDTADLNNIGNSGTAGAITAALFLREFVHPAMKWAHLDIAGTGLPSKPRSGMPAGASGVGVRSLTEVALKLASLSR